MLAIKQIFDKAGDGATIIDAEQRIVSWNAAATRMLGYRSEEVVGRHCWQLLGGKTPQGQHFCQKDCALRQHIAADEQINNFDLLLRHQCGELVPVNVSTIPIPVSDRYQPVTLVHLWRVQQRSPVLTSGLRIRLLGPMHVRRPDGSAVTGAL